MGSVTAPLTAVARPLQIGPYRCDTPVVLAPMAGITNPGFRRLCREQGAGFYVCEMITSRGPRGAQPADLPDDRLRRGRAPALAAALRGGPGDGRGRGARDRRRGRPRRPRRPQLRLPGPQGHAARRRGGAALQAAAVRADRACRRRQRRASARHRQDADRDRRRAPHPPRRRPDRRRRGGRGRRPARADGGAALLGDGRLVRDRPAARRAAGRAAGAGQRRHLQRGGRARDGRRDRVRRRGRRARLPGPAVAVRRSRGRVRRPSGARPRRRWARSR